jgi:two-component system, NtrC family, nitrogen regulation response regulator GlnG
MKPVMLIDDDIDVRDVIVYALENDNLKVNCFENGKLGLDALKRLSPEDYPGLIIVDFMMPEMDGLTFIKEVREKHPDTIGKIPIAISSAAGVMDSKITSTEDLIFLHKPMDLFDLLKVAKEHCS